LNWSSLSLNGSFIIQIDELWLGYAVRKRLANLNVIAPVLHQIH